MTETNIPDPVVTVPWTQLLNLELKLRYAKRELCEAVMFASGDQQQHLDDAYVKLVQATKIVMELIKGQDNDN
jgi:hypothetical protein